MKSPISILMGLMLVLAFPTTAFAQISFGKFLEKVTEPITDKKPKNQQNFPPSPMEQLSTGELAKRDVIKSTITGAVGGAILGGIIGNNTGDGDAKKGALYGAVGGGLVGFVAGNVAADRRKAFATQSAFLDNEIQSTETAIAVKSSQLQQANIDLAQTQRDVNSLVVQHSQNIDVSAQVATEKETLRSRIKGYDSTLETYQASIEYLTELQSNQQLAPGESHAELSAKQVSLSQKKTTLVAQYNNLNNIKQQNIYAMNRLETIASG